ncbi:hypothetical protein [Hominilimicola fabiformis]|uniref:Uncharacterized protein n=1 Tax=Hominilimicola fabiformis TaxID=2885356 RepID=A0AAE3DZQ8_9FIRM|nr:hypothetical protein [Hominilimicola fabiformis]MCC2210836.1 hypothetical protein [Hominilimicola fabiformis]
MKSKKLISLLCAAAMSASAFAGLTVTASAATPVYTFDGSDITGFSGNGTLAQVSDDKGEYFSIKANGSSTYSATLTLPADAQLTSADGYTIEYDARLHKSNGMGRYGRYTQVAFIDSSNAAKDSRDYGPYGALFSGGNSSTETGQGYTAGVASSLSARYQLDGTIVNDPGTETLAADNTSVTGIADDMWVRVQTYVKGDVAKVTVIDVNNNKIVDGVDYINSATKLDTIYVTAGRGDDSVTGPGEVCLDNIKIYSGEAETLTTDGLRGVVAAATPIPEPETVSGSAQTLAAPASVTDAYTADFNNATVGTVASIETEDQDAKTVVDGMKVKVGSRSTGADTKTYAAIAKVATGDNALKLAANQFSTNGRGPVVTLDDTKEISSGETAIMGFTTYLSAAKGTDEGGLPRLFLIDNTTNIDGNGCARDILAVITTEDASGYTNGDTPIGIQVTEGWHTVVVAVSEGTYRVFIDGKYKDGEGKLSPAVKGTKVGSGSTSAQVTHLPSFAVENTKSDSGTAYSKALIDNVVAYKITDTLDAKYLPTETAAPTPAPIPAKVTMSVDENANTVTLTSDKDTDAVLVQASYRTDNTLDSVKKVVNVALTAGTAYTVPATDLDAFTTNDKIMVWDSLKTMTPLASAYTIKNGAAQATAKPAPTAEPTEAPAETVAPTTEPTEAPAETGAPTVEPTEAPAETGAPTVEPTEAPAETAAPTDTPAPTATAVPTYAVSGTVDAGVKSVTLTDKAEAENTITGTIEDTAVTFTGVKAGTYTVSAVAKDDYKDLTVTPQEITVSGNLEGVFTVTTTAKVKSAVTTAVTGGTATVTGATDLTSVAEGTELTITAKTPALGYLAADPTITVTKTDDAETTVTVAEGKFTMPTYPVTVTVAYAADPTMKVFDAEASTWVKADDTTAHGSDELLKLGQWAKGKDGTLSTNETTLLRYAGLSDVDKDRVVSANLNFDVASTSYDANQKRWVDSYFFIGALSSNDWDASTAVYTDYQSIRNDSLTDTKVWTGTKDATTASTEAHGAFVTANVPVTSLVKSATTDKLSLELAVGTARTQVVKKAPKLVLTIGQAVTFNVASGETKVEKATVEIKNGDAVVATETTDTDGVAKVALPSGDYTYTVTSADYAIKTGSIKVADSAVAENVAVVANEAKKVEITSPENNIVVVGSPITFTATVKDQDGRVMTGKTVNWTVVDTPANIAVENGVVSVTNGVIGGKYKVQATIADTEISATADFEVVAKSKGTLKAIYTTGDETTGVVETVDVYTEDDNKFEADEVTVPESYLSERVVTNSDTGLYDVYSYVSGGTDKITLAAGENKVVIVVKKDASYNVYEKFEDEKPLFKADSRITVKIEDDATLNSKVVGFTCAGNAGNGYSFAHYALPDTVTKDIVTFDFDYYNTNGGRAILSIGDATTRGTTGGSTKVTYNSTGAIFNLGSNKTNALVQGDSSKAIGDYTNKWMHVNVVVNQSTKKVSYTITNKADGAEIAKATDVAFVDATTENLKATQIDIFGYINNSHCAMLDNIKVTESDATTSATE